MKAEKKDDGFIITLESDVEKSVIKQDIKLRSEGKTIFDVASDSEGLMALFTADGKHSPEEIKKGMLDEDARVVEMFTQMLAGKPITVEDFRLLIWEIDGAGNMRCGGWRNWGRTTKHENDWHAKRKGTKKEKADRKGHQSRLHHMMIDALKLAEEFDIELEMDKLCWTALEKEDKSKVIEVEDRPDLLARADL